jgi:hypothetical protein
MGGAIAEKMHHRGIHHDHYLDHAVDITTGKPFCRVKAESLCWDTSICKDGLPNCKTCLRRVKKLIAAQPVVALRIYSAMSVFLPDVPPEHRGNNNNCQFSVLIAASSQRRVAELLHTSLSGLRNFNGIHEAPQDIGYMTEAKPVVEIVQKDETFYYFTEHTRSGFIGKWFEYVPKR